MTNAEMLSECSRRANEVVQEWLNGQEAETPQASLDRLETLILTALCEVRPPTEEDEAYVQALVEAGR